MNTTTINRIKRVTSLIAENAKNATPGHWAISHSHVYTTQRDEKTGEHKFFDIASQPYERSRCVYGVHPDQGGMGWKDMKHIATCAPHVMTKLTEDVTELLAERDDVVALAVRLDDLINQTILADGQSGNDDPRAKALGEAVEAYLSSAP